MTGLARTIQCRQEQMGQLQGIMLDVALLCVTCDTIYPSVGTGTNSGCPNCTFHNYLKLSKILNRTEGDENSITQ